MEAKLLNRVRALLAKAEATTFPEEAEAFTAKAAELASRYGIDEAMLAAAGQSTDRVDRTRINIGNPYSAEKALLLGSIAAVYRCRCLTYGSPRNVHYVIVFGYGVDRERAELLYTSLYLQATTQAQQQWPAYSHMNVNLYRRSWWYGFSATVQDRLTEIEERTQRDTDDRAEAGTPGTAVVLADRRADVTREFENAYPDLECTKPPPVDMVGFLAGTAAGEVADLGQGGLDAQPRRALG